MYINSQRLGMGQTRLKIPTLLVSAILFPIIALLCSIERPCYTNVPEIYKKPILVHTLFYHSVCSVVQTLYLNPILSASSRLVNNKHILPSPSSSYSSSKSYPPSTSPCDTIPCILCFARIHKSASHNPNSGTRYVPMKRGVSRTSTSGQERSFTRVYR